MAKSQDSNRNYIVSRSYLNESASEHTTSVQYFDGLGRKTQLATDETGTNNQFVYTFTEYDQCGRDSVTWLPRTGNAVPQYADDFVADTNAPYDSSDYPFAITSYDAMSRPVKITTPGSAWYSNDKAKRLHYYTNSESEEIKKYTTESKDDEIVIDNGFYPDCSLFREELTDEDNHIVVQYKNLRGDIIMERNNGEDTYYVYDIYNNLRFVLPPNCPSITTSDLYKYAYIYKYDNRNRCCEKKLPGCDPVIYRYDVGDHVVITQDPILREKSLYRFTLYDELGRIAVQGTCQQYLSFMLNGNLSVVFNPGNSGIGGSCYSFVNTSLPSFIVNPEIEVVNYYDNYAFFLQFSSSSLYGNFSNLNAMRPNAETAITGDNAFNAYGQKTGEIVAASNRSLLYSSYFYDEKGRLIEDHHSTLDGKVYKVFTEYSFTDKPTQVTKVIPALDDNMAIVGRPSYTIDDYSLITSYSYNSHNDQLESVSVQCGNNAPVVVSQITYDELGRVRSNSHPEINDVINYEYDLHGWTTGINGSYFKETLHYADGPNNGNYCYNGDISAQEWMASDTIQRGYKFFYNDRDMLYNAVYGEKENLATNTNHYNENITEFNANGAIVRLLRKGKSNAGNYTTIDHLIYDYDGNKVKAIRDRNPATLSYNGAFEYKNTHNATNAEPDFEYNSAGMLIKDRDKGINRIKYNDIGLVDSIIFDNGAKVEYTYGLNGEKLKVVHRVPQSNLTGTDLGNGLVIQRPIQLEYNTREYLGGDVELEGESWIYGKTYKYYFGDGYVQFYPGETTAPKFYFYSKDHLGNVRSVVTKNPTTNEIAEVQQTHYYPFGGIIADLSTGRSVQNKLYNGKELDSNNNLWWYDYGARQYDPTAPRFTTPDPLAEKYYGWNMYGYCANNPVKYTDPDGRDYGVTMDDENKTITISATYYAVTEDLSLAQESIAVWNNASGQFCYVTDIGDHYTINFDLTVKEVEDTYNNKVASLTQALNSDKSGQANAFFVVSKLNEGITQSTGEIVSQNGVTLNGNTIKIAEARSKTPQTSAHEEGHTLGMNHTSRGLMTATSNDRRRNDRPTAKNVQESIHYAMKGKKGHCKSTFINKTSYTNEQLRNGKVE